MITLFQATIDITSRANEISPMTEFAPTVAGLIRALFFVAALLTFGYMLWGAFDWILSEGDSGKIETARRKITQALIGLAVLASVGAIFRVVQYMIGVEVLN
jgi:hypothetical protein